jgi:hypothetical protein
VNNTINLEWLKHIEYLLIKNFIHYNPHLISCSISLVLMSFDVNCVKDDQQHIQKNMGIWDTTGVFGQNILLGKISRVWRNDQFMMIGYI